MPELIGTLGDDASGLGVIAILGIRIGHAPFGGLTESKEGIAEGIRRLHALWPLHREAATEFCVKRYGPAKRPLLWWLHDCPRPGRPFVKPRDWLDLSDAVRFQKERAQADRDFLEKHKLLTPEEKNAIAEARMTKHFGLVIEQEDSNEAV